MNVTVQKRLAILGAVLLTGLFVLANAHLIAVAFHSQTGCVAPAPDRMPAKHAC